jgi:TolB-like protein/Flp pilus assembly protein TadD
MESTSSGRRVRFGPFEIDEKTGELRKDGTKIRLQEQPLQILQILLEHPGELVARDELRKRVWPTDTFVDFDHGINNAIKRLRESLGETAETPRFVETLPRRGYRFIASLEAARPVANSPIQAIAVLPLENLSRDPEREYFADGMTEALITGLAKISALRVTSRTTVMKYKGIRDKSVPEIAKELGVARIIEGAVLRSGDRVRISVQLIDPSTDAHLWAESYERNLRDVLSLQAEVARTVAGEIQVKVTPQELVHLTPAHCVNPDAYEAYLKGRYYWNKRTLEGLSKGMEYFRQAIEQDPLYASAYAGLADSSSRLAWWGFMPPNEGFGAAKAAALKALEIDNSSADAHASLGFSLLHHDCAFSAAEAECRRGVDLEPRNPLPSQALACCLIATGRFDEGIAEAMRLIDLDPLSLPMRWSASAFFYHARQYDRAIAQAQKCLELDSSFCPSRWTIALSEVARGSSESGIPELEEAVRATRENQFFLGALGYCYAKAGRKADAGKLLGRMQELAKERYISGYWQAAIYGALREYHKAFDCLEAAYHEHSSWMPYVRVASFFDDLRSDPRFDDLVQRMNFP